MSLEYQIFNFFLRKCVNHKIVITGVLFLMFYPFLYELLISTKDVPTIIKTLPIVFNFLHPIFTLYFYSVCISMSTHFHNEIYRDTAILRKIVKKFVIIPSIILLVLHCCILFHCLDPPLISEELLLYWPLANILFVFWMFPVKLATILFTLILYYMKEEVDTFKFEPNDTLKNRYLSISNEHFTKIQRTQIFLLILNGYFFLQAAVFLMLFKDISKTTLFQSKYWLHEVIFLLDIITVFAANYSAAELYGRYNSLMLRLQEYSLDNQIADMFDRIFRYQVATGRVGYSILGILLTPNLFIGVTQALWPTIVTLANLYNTELNKIK